MLIHKTVAIHCTVEISDSKFNQEDMENIMMNFRKIFYGLSLSSCLLASNAWSVELNVIDGSHDVINGSSNSTTSLVTLGHTSTLLSDSASGWSTATSESKTIVVEQDASDNANISDVQSFLSSGGRMIVLGGSDEFIGSFIDQIFGWSTTTAFNASGVPFSKVVANVTGTTFEDDPATIYGLNSHHEITNGTPAGAEVFYQGATGAAVIRATYGLGDLFYLGYDFCCGGTTEQANDWYTVLDSAINFAETENGVPVPAPLALMGLGLAGLRLNQRRMKA
ncbi:MAG: hypothetical protein PVG66_08030 [Chromatiales bacterium]